MNGKWFRESGFYRKWIPLVAVLTVFDQVTKLAAYLFLNRQTGLMVIPYLLQFQYLENKGAAFGILKNRQWLFVLFALIIMVLMTFFYIKLPDTKKYRPLRFVSCILSAGALGNMIDRLLHTYVIDFIYFSFIDFPVFNVADIYVVLGCAAFLLLILFRYRDEDFDMFHLLKK